MPKPYTAAPYLDGIRGVAAFLVFVHHFLLCFYPAHYSFNIKETNLHGWDVAYGRNVLSVFTNGNYCVFIFFVLSGFVLSRKYYHTGDIETPVWAQYKRFVRLYIPVAFSLVVCYLLIKSHLFFNVAASQLSKSDWWLRWLWVTQTPEKDLWNSLKYETMINGFNGLNVPLWTISNELFGSMLVFAFLMFVHFTRHRLFLLFVMLFYFYCTSHHIYFSFMLGVTLCHTEARATNSFHGNIAAMLLIPLALVLGSYPSNNEMKGTLFADLGHTLLEYKAWFHAVGAYLLVLAFVLSPQLQKVASLRAVRFLGYISFSLYLLHMAVLGSLGCALFIYLHSFMNYHAATTCVFVVTTLAVIPLSWLMTKYVDEKGIYLAEKAASRLLNRRGQILSASAISQ